MTTYYDINNSIARVPRNYVSQVTKALYDGNAKVAELIVDLTDPAAPALFIGNVTGNMASVLTGTQSNANIVNIFSNTINSNTIVTNTFSANTANIITINSNTINSNTANFNDLTSSNTVNFSNASNVTLGNVSNIHISGGSNLMVLTTDGFGNLSWSYKVAIGDVKQSLKTADHDGWFLMDGRAVAGLGLTASQTAAAASLGLVNLPNATDRVLKQKAAAVGSVGGQNTVTIAAVNLPSTGLTTSSAGDHNHIVFAAAEGRGYAAVENDNSFVKVGAGPEYRSANAGTHNHNLTGGNDVPLNIESSYVVVNAFVFLGT